MIFLPTIIVLILGSLIAFFLYKAGANYKEAEKIKEEMKKDMIRYEKEFFNNFKK